MRRVRALVTNGALLALPPLALSLALWSSLPPAYGPEIFWLDIPPWLGLTENALRVVVFALPAALRFDTTEAHRAGWSVYAAGLALYAASYLLHVFWPGSAWALGAVGFTAPAWTTAVWFVGIAMVCRESWLPIRWRWWLYLVPVVAFVSAHVAHAALVWSRR